MATTSNPKSVSTCPLEFVVVQETVVGSYWEVVVYVDPKELVVAKTKPDSVRTCPSEVVVHVTTEELLENSEVVVNLEPAEFVVTNTKPESVSTWPSELVVVHVTRDEEAELEAANSEVVRMVEPSELLVL